MHSSKIIYVEDNLDDVTLMTLAWRKAGVDAQLEIASDGDKAIAVLREAMSSTSPFPSCILLDVKLPTISGLELLEWIRQQPGLRRLPVIMLTSSLLPGDINRAYDLGANSYLIKPPDLGSLVELARVIDQYWVRTNTPPAAAEMVFPGPALNSPMGKSAAGAA